MIRDENREGLGAKEKWGSKVLGGKRKRSEIWTEKEKSWS
jgi:hypothetical protein